MSLAASELTWMRATQEASMPGTCQVKHTPMVADGYGGQTAGTATLTSYACRVAPSSGRELTIAGKMTAALSWTVTLPHDASVLAQDQIVYGARTFEVLALLGGGSWETARRVIAIEVGSNES